MKKPTDKALREFAEKQTAHFMEHGEHPANVVGFGFDGMFIINPYTTECGRFEVEPAEHYGADNWALWIMGAGAHVALDCAMIGAYRLAHYSTTAIISPLAAVDFLLWLQATGLAYHPDDCAADCLRHHGLEDADLAGINARMAECHNVLSPFRDGVHEAALIILRIAQGDEEPAALWEFAGMASNNFHNV